MLDSILYSIVAAFIAWEGVAHFALHNKSGHTLSNRILAAETRWGIPIRVLVACACAALGVHLQGVF